MTAVEPAAPGPFGIKGKLFLAICALAGLTAIASAVAWYVFADIDRTVTRVTGESLPGMVSALNLAELSAEIAATAPSLMASRDQEERVREQVKLAQRTGRLAALIRELGDRQGGTDVSGNLAPLADAITAKLRALDAAIERRLHFKAMKDRQVADLARIHAQFLNAIEPLVDDSFFDLVINGERTTAHNTKAITGLVEGGVNRLNLLLRANAEANLTAGLLVEALHVHDQASLRPIEDSFAASAAAVDNSLERLPDDAGNTPLQAAATELLAFGRGSDSVFASRRQTPGTGASADHDRRLAPIKDAQAQLQRVAAPLIDEAAASLVLATETISKQSHDAVTELIDVGARTLHELLTLRAEGNLAAGILNQVAVTPEAALLQPLHERFVAATEQMQRMSDALPPAVPAGDLRKTATAMLDIGRADDGLFALRRDELRHMALAQTALDDSRALTIELGGKVAGLVKATRDASDAAAARSGEAVAGGKLIIIVLTVAGVLGAAVVMFAYVGPRIIRPLEHITAAMTDLAAGDTAVDIPGRDRSDELGRMAQALGVFRDTAIEMQESNLREIRETRRRLSDAIESISEAFSLYDSDDRLVVCNGMYRTLLYPGFADEIVPGMTFEAIVRRAVERGYIRDAGDDPEDWLASRLQRHREPTGSWLQQRGDGRWIMVSERRTEDGGTVAVYSDITELKQREQELAEKSNALEQLSNQLAKYLSPQVYESIFSGRQEVTVAAQRKKLTVFFSDIVGFTETSDRLESEELTALLNHYLTEMSRIATEYGATIDKYVGDTIMIFFGDPESRGIREDALACVRMAIAMRERMRDLETMWRESGIENPLTCRIGMNTGFCTVGNFGSEDRLDYTIIGGGVNLASRLESAAAPGAILISYETYALVKDEIACEEHGQITVKGIAYPVTTYQVIDAYDRMDAQPRRIREDQPNLKLSLDLDAMSADEREQAAAVLRGALDRVSRTD